MTIEKIVYPHLGIIDEVEVEEEIPEENKTDNINNNKVEKK